MTVGSASSAAASWAASSPRPPPAGAPGGPGRAAGGSRASATPTRTCCAWYQRLEPRAGLVTGLPRAARDRRTSTPFTAPCPTTCTRRSMSTSLARRQAPARREAVRDRPRGGERIGRGRQRARTFSCAARPSFRSFPAARWALASTRARGPDPGGERVVPAFARPRSEQGDQLEAPWRSSTASTAAWATSGCTRCTCRCGSGGRRECCARLAKVVTERPGRQGRPGAVRDVGQRAACGRGRRRPGSRCAWRRADRAGRDEHVVARDPGTEGSGAVLDKSPKSLRVDGVLPGGAAGAGR